MEGVAMDYRRDSHGEQTFFEHWWLLGFATIASLASLVSHILGTISVSWRIALCVGAFALMIAGAWLIGYAKLPAYRDGRFFSFGVKSVPRALRHHYLKGWRLFYGGMMLTLLVLASGL
jgi:hypothetical protein